jgi:hypothetical protein
MQLAASLGWTTQDILRDPTTERDAVYKHGGRPRTDLTN